MLQGITLFLEIVGALAILEIMGLAWMKWSKWNKRCKHRRKYNLYSRPTSVYWTCMVCGEDGITYRNRSDTV